MHGCPLSSPLHFILVSPPGEILVGLGVAPSVMLLVLKFGIELVDKGQISTVKR